MPKEVLFHAARMDEDTSRVEDISKNMLEELIDREGIELAEKVPLKVHFGEVGNETYLGPDNYNGVIEFLRERKIESCFIETNVLYGGKHRSGFNRLCSGGYL